jgi:hypothetical protein
LYKSNPSDPQIIQWQNAMQQEINTMKDLCFELSFLPTEQSTIDRVSEIEQVILPNCQIHPNSLLACEDPRFEKYVQTQGKGAGFPQVGVRIS